MRKFVPYQLSSLDGVADEPSQSIAEFDDVMRANLGWVIASLVSRPVGGTRSQMGSERDLCGSREPFSPQNVLRTSDICGY